MSYVHALGSHLHANECDIIQILANGITLFHLSDCWQVNMDINNAGFKMFKTSALKLFEEMRKEMYTACWLDFKDTHNCLFYEKVCGNSAFMGGFMQY